MNESGQVAYEIYCRQLDPQAPSWSGLDETRRDCWRRLAWEVIRTGWLDSQKPPWR